MEAMLTSLQGAITTSIPLMLVTAGAVAAIVITIPIARKAYAVVRSFLGRGAA